eukprot:6897871-Prymnesium_polylepis.1
MAGFGTDVDAAAAALKKKFTLEKYYGFNPTVKRTVADVVEISTGKKMRVAKGIVSKVLKTQPDDGGQQWTVADYENTKEKVLSADATFGKSGYKTIAIAVSVNGGPMLYAGTLPIMDPPRADTAETIRKIKESYVEVKMITGDHLNIAKELARQIQLGTNIFPNTSLAVDGTTSAEAVKDLILKADGFAQVMPKDKHE